MYNVIALPVIFLMATNRFFKDHSIIHSGDHSYNYRQITDTDADQKTYSSNNSYSFWKKNNHNSPHGNDEAEDDANNDELARIIGTDIELAGRPWYAG